MLSTESLEKIDAAINKVYQDASYQGNSNITSLYKLITNAYPIRLDEVENLSYYSANKFLARNIGLDIDLPEHTNHKLAGFLYAREYGGSLYGCILVEKKDPVVRRRFTAAHELGHYLLHLLPVLQQDKECTRLMSFTEGLSYFDGVDDKSSLPVGELATHSVTDVTTSIRMASIEQLELEANQFAANILMPEITCKNLVEDYQKRFFNPQPSLIRRLANEFLVSQEAMKWRLNSLGLIDFSQI